MDSIDPAALLEIVRSLTNELNGLKGKIDDAHNEEMERIGKYQREHLERVEKRRQLKNSRRKIDFCCAVSIIDGKFEISDENPIL